MGRKQLGNLSVSHSGRVNGSDGGGRNLHSGQQTRKWTVGEIIVPLGVGIIRPEWCTKVPEALLVLVILEVSWPSTGKVELFLLLGDICCLWLIGMSNHTSESPWTFEPTHSSQLISDILCWISSLLLQDL